MNQSNKDNNRSLFDLTIHNIYAKDVSFEAPNTPLTFTYEWKPKLDFDLSMSHVKLEDDLFEVTLKITVTVNILREDEQQKEQEEVAFLVEVKQAGVFAIEEKLLTADQIDRILSTAAPTILLPYAREIISSCVNKGGFPQLILPPMNFEAMYQEHLEQQEPQEKSQIIQ